MDRVLEFKVGELVEHDRVPGTVGTVTKMRRDGIVHVYWINKQDMIFYGTNEGHHHVTMIRKIARP